ncbi:bifunctional nicotinamidase/pyrazinamidase [Kiloniella sp. EL199]|uniref:bifunctional nicotinamidase/pyrazinamidase n=1 Tax=Kiloniella sp. EL199 TaxID=2107581 RepID=UPI000EA32DCB|nr:bifunctional nicotinamidase/pyrazinamidase [Kiloniella sp. EL199]
MSYSLDLSSRDALLIIDLQNDFCTDGALAVPEGEAIVPVVNKLIDRFPHALATQDWHPEGHLSFVSSHEGQTPYETIELSYGQQVLWPDHCVQGKDGSTLHKNLNKNALELILRKGFRKEIDSYSAFFENDKTTSTGLTGYLRERQIERVFLCGLATDFCVYYSAIDAIKQGFETFVIADACRAIDLDGSLAKAMTHMRESGVEILSSDEL